MSVSLSADIDARVQDIVERTTRDQGLTLAVTDPVVLHQLAGLILATEDGGRA